MRDRLHTRMLELLPSPPPYRTTEVEGVATLPVLTERPKRE
jgi:hypothetical protein